MSIFSKISLKRPKRTVHNLSYSSKLSLGFGELVPIMCEKVVPGDKFVHGHEFLMRFAPMAGQVFQSFHTRVDYFFVPSRLIWKNFERFLVDDAGDYPHPYFSGSDIWDGQSLLNNTLIDYFNLPTVNYSGLTPQPIDGSGTNLKIDALPFAAYIKILFDYYLDENLPFTYLQDDGQGGYDTVSVSFEDALQQLDDIFSSPSLNGNYYALALAPFMVTINASGRDIDTVNPFETFHKAYPKDYFTSALPWAQRGPIVQIPLNGEGDVTVQAMNNGLRFQGVGVDFTGTPAGTTGEMVDVKLYNRGELFHMSNLDQSNNPLLSENGTAQFGYGSRQLNGISSGNSYASDVTQEVLEATNNHITFRAVNVNGTATINDLRTAMTVQAWLEKNARAGVRYKEQLYSHFGVRSKDYRLDRAQLLSSSKANVSIGEVFSTSAGTNQITGLGVSTATGATAVKPWKHYFDEHGYVIGFLTIYPTAGYSQGVPRQFLELDRFEYYWPEFQNIGEQEILNAELFVDDSVAANNFKTFGYTPRYAQYKTRGNQIHGDFRTTMPFMTASRIFQNAPTLNRDFISIDPAKNNLNRVFNASAPYNPNNSKPVYVDFFHNFKAIRPMQYFGNPRII